MEMRPTGVIDSASQKQLAVLIECPAENEPSLAQVLVYLCFPHSHCMSDYLRVENRSSAPLPFPPIRIARCCKGVLLERMIGTKRTNALKGRSHWWPELGKCRHLVQQFPSNDLVLSFIPRWLCRDCKNREIRFRTDTIVLAAPEIGAYPRTLVPT